MTRAVILVIAYCVSLLAAGHGAVPLGLLLVMGNPDSWIIGQLLAWAGIAGLIAATIAYRRAPVPLAVSQLAASAVLYLSWIVFAYIAARPSLFWGDVANNWIVSLPFQLAFVVVAVLNLRHIRRARPA